MSASGSLMHTDMLALPSVQASSAANSGSSPGVWSPGSRSASQGSWSPGGWTPSVGTGQLTTYSPVQYGPPTQQWTPTPSRTPSPLVSGHPCIWRCSLSCGDWKQRCKVTTRLLPLGIARCCRMLAQIQSHHCELQACLMSSFSNLSS